jgi:hypothetical protein
MTFAKITQNLALIGLVMVAGARAQQPADAPNAQSPAPAAPGPAASSSAAPANPTTSAPSPTASSPGANTGTTAKPDTQASAPAPLPPSADTLKAARLAGYRQKTQKNGTYLYCKTDTELGTHFATEKCVNEPTLMAILEREQVQREQLRQSPCSAGCGSSK